MRFLVAAVIVVAAVNACTGSEPDLDQSQPAGDGGAPDVAPPATPSLKLAALQTQFVIRGGSIRVPIAITRTAFDTGVRVETVELPSGTSAPPLILASGTSTGDLEIRADAGAPQTAVTIRVRAVSVSDEKITDEQTMLIVVRGPAGAVDETFGVKGVASLNAIGAFRALALSSDASGRLLLLANERDTTIVGRFDADGKTDGTFGTGGQTTLTFKGTGLEPQVFDADVAVRSDGRIVIAARHTLGGLGSGASVAGLTPAGQNDSAFGATGGITVSGDGAYSVARQPDDGVLVAVSGSAPLQRFRADNTFESGFASARGSISGRTTIANVTSGLFQAWAEGSDVKLARIVPSTGDVDSTFGSGGIASMPPLTGVTFSAMSGDAQGRIYLLAQDTAPWIIRIANGSVDPGFSGSATSWQYLPPGTAKDVIADGNGCLVALDDPNPGKGVLERLRDDGKPDGAFGSAGFAAAPPGTIAKLLVQDQRVVAAITTPSGAVLVRWWR